MAGSTINSTEAYEKILTANLQRAIDFLKFAEAKNAALLALISAWVVASINFICSDKIIPACLSVSVSLALVFALTAGLLAMLSFMPRLQLPTFLGGKRAGPHPKNLLYYSDISSLPIKTFEQDIHANYFPDAKGYKDSYLHDLIVQISVNSEITLRKMRLFRWAMGLVLLAGSIILPPVLMMALKSMGVLW